MKYTKTCSICNNTKTEAGWRKNSVCQKCYNNVVFKEIHGVTYAQYAYKKNKDKCKSKWNEWARTLKGQFVTSKNKAKKNKKDWNLTFEEYCEIRQGKCHYCNGKLPSTSRGLDRLDSSKGYLKDNVVPCCGYCNEIKGQNISESEMVEIIKLLKRLRKTDILWTK